MNPLVTYRYRFAATTCLPAILACFLSGTLHATINTPANKVAGLIHTHAAITSTHIVDRILTGTVTNQRGEPLAGVSVLIEGTTTGTVTDAAGKFSLPVPENAATTVAFSFVGYTRQTVVVDKQTTVSIVLAEAAGGLNEVVVIGYSSVRKRDLTGAVSVISNRDIANIPVGGVDQIMQGKAAGVAVTSSTGAPGDAIAVRIRGVGTINDNSPLYVIDGIPTKNGINEISPNDIESINILKDASSTAIYGARASNGVVIVTTRHGRSGKARLNLSAYSGVQTAANLIKMADTKQYVQAYNTAATNDGRPLIPTTALDTLPNVNWLKEVLKPASRVRDGCHGDVVRRVGYAKRRSRPSDDLPLRIDARSERRAPAFSRPCERSGRAGPSVRRPLRRRPGAP